MSSHESDEHVRDAAELRSMNTMDEMRWESIRSLLLCNNAQRGSQPQCMKQTSGLVARL